jgi:hypothetical protein
MPRPTLARPVLAAYQASERSGESGARLAEVLIDLAEADERVHRTLLQLIEEGLVEDGSLGREAIPHAPPRS